METDNRPKVNKTPDLMVFLILVFLLGVGLGGCGGWRLEFDTPDIPPAPCPIQDLLLDVSDFLDDDWEETGSRSERDAPVRIGVERIGTSFSTVNGGVLQDVYRIGYEHEARKAYKDLARSWFTPSEHETDYAIPTEMSNLAVNADQYQVGCNDLKSGDFELCQYVAQYSSYVIRLFAHMRALTKEEFIGLVNGIDQRATNCLEQ